MRNLKLDQGRDMKTYTGDRTIDGIKVLADGQLLPDRIDLRRYAEMGFEWGYEGAEPRQLAFALLLDHTGNLNLSADSSESFMKVMVANFDNEWSITSADIESWLLSKSAY